MYRNNDASVSACKALMLAVCVCVGGVVIFTFPSILQLIMCLLKEENSLFLKIKIPNTKIENTSGENHQEMSLSDFWVLCPYLQFPRLSLILCFHSSSSATSPATLVNNVSVPRVSLFKNPSVAFQMKCFLPITS